jgi:hypothetical protein
LKAALAAEKRMSADDGGAGARPKTRLVPIVVEARAPEPPAVDVPGPSSASVAEQQLYPDVAEEKARSGEESVTFHPGKKN